VHILKERVGLDFSGKSWIQKTAYISTNLTSV